MEPARSTGKFTIGRGVHQPYRHPFDARVRDLDHATLPSVEECTHVKRCPATNFASQMTTIYSARWVLPLSAPPIENGAVAVAGQQIVGVGPHADIVARFPQFRVQTF